MYLFFSKSVYEFKIYLALVTFTPKSLSLHNFKFSNFFNVIEQLKVFVFLQVLR